jgi:Prokaryotic phospholipase A2
VVALLHVRRMARYRVVLVGAILVAVGLVLYSSATPSVALAGGEPATPANAALHEHPWNATGCTIPGASLDSVPGLFDFQHACIHHGGCYEGLDRQGSPAVIDRLRCDQLFHADLVSSCAVMHGASANWRAAECKNTAESYYEVVRSFGGPYYTGSGNAA